MATQIRENFGRNHAHQILVILTTLGLLLGQESTKPQHGGWEDK